MSRILVAEDEWGIASFVLKGLRANGYTASHAADGDTALFEARSGQYDLLVLDLGLPGRDGLSVLRALRKAKVAIPVVILTARDDPATLVEGLDAGADDFIAKPFRFDELLARVRTRLRVDHLPTESTLRFGDIEFDARARRVLLDGAPVELSSREYRVLETFLRHPGQILSREQLLSHAWGRDFAAGSNIVDVYVRALRKKLGAAVIETVRGLGYRLGDGSRR